MRGRVRILRAPETTDGGGGGGAPPPKPPEPAPAPRLEPAPTPTKRDEIPLMSESTAAKLTDELRKYNLNADKLFPTPAPAPTPAPSPTPAPTPAPAPAKKKYRSAGWFGLGEILGDGGEKK